MIDIMNDKLSLKQAEEVITRSPPEVQQRFLAALPHLLHLEREDLALLKLAEPSFDFWNNTSDIIYDSL